MLRKKAPTLRPADVDERTLDGLCSRILCMFCPRFGGPAAGREHCERAAVEYYEANRKQLEPILRQYFEQEQAAGRFHGKSTPWVMEDQYIDVAESSWAATETAEP